MSSSVSSGSGGTRRSSGCVSGLSRSWSSATSLGSSKANLLLGSTAELGGCIEASTSLWAEELRVGASVLRVRTVLSRKVVASVTTNTHSVLANHCTTVAGGNLIAIATVSTRQRRACRTTVLNFDWRTTVGVGNRTDLSVLRATSLVLRVVAAVGFSTEILPSAAQLHVVGAELHLGIVAAVATEVRSHRT